MTIIPRDKLFTYRIKSKKYKIEWLLINIYLQHWRSILDDETRHFSRKRIIGLPRNQASCFGVNTSRQLSRTLFFLDFFPLFVSFLNESFKSLNFPFVCSFVQTFKTIPISSRHNLAKLHSRTFLRIKLSLVVSPYILYTPKKTQKAISWSFQCFRLLSNLFSPRTSSNVN